MQRGIQSIEVGGRLLSALADAGRPLALKDLAQSAGMSPPKAHPYLVSFGKLGLVVQESASGRYGLGPLAMQIGLISLQQYDPLRLASARLAELARSVDQMAAIVVWGNRGPTIVRTEEPATPVHVAMRHGTVMSVHGTASGRVFAAWLPRETVRSLLRREHTAAKAAAAFERELATVRRQRLAQAHDAAVPGVSAIAAPVFGAAGEVALALTVIGPTAVLDTSLAGDTAATLLRLTAELTAQLGGHPPAG